MGKRVIVFIFYFLGILLSKAQVPSFQWATSIGSISGDQGYSVTTDIFGNVYTTGVFSGVADFDPGSGTYTLSTLGGYDIFISKLDPLGNFLWAKRMGGSNSDGATCITTDPSGDVYLTGGFRDTIDMDPGPLTFSLVSFGNDDAFVCKLSSLGNLIWAKQIGGVGNDFISSLTIDPFGNIYSAGSFQSTTDFDPGIGTYSLTSIGSLDAFVLKLDASGSFVWARKIGSSANDGALGICADQLGNIYSTGYFSFTADFDPGAAVVNLTSAGLYDSFVWALDAGGNYLWAKNFGGLQSDMGYSINSDASGNLYSTGTFVNISDLDPGVGTSTVSSNGLNDIYVSKLDNSGSFLWGKSFGGTNQDYVNGIVLDASNGVYTTGAFQGTVDFDPNATVYNMTAVAFSADAFISKLDVSGNFGFALQFGSPNGSFARAITLDPLGSIYTTGYFSGTCDFDPGLGTYTLTAVVAVDIFISRLGYGPADVENFISPENNVLVYPNPVSSTLFISSAQYKLENSEIEIINYLGQTVLKTRFKKELNVSELSDGIYTFQIKTPQNEIDIKRLIIAK